MRIKLKGGTFDGSILENTDPEAIPPSAFGLTKDASIDPHVLPYSGKGATLGIWNASSLPHEAKLKGRGKDWRAQYRNTGVVDDDGKIVFEYTSDTGVEPS